MSQDQVPKVDSINLSNRGNEVDDNSLEFIGDDYEILEDLECEIVVTKEPTY